MKLLEKKKKKRRIMNLLLYIMLNLNRSNFQAHPFHLVSPSPWPLYTSISLLSLTTSAVLSFHGFAYAEYNLMMSLISLVLAMSFWWRDVIAEGKLNLVPCFYFFRRNFVFFFDVISMKLLEKKKEITRKNLRGLGGKTLFNYNLNIAKAIPVEDLKKYLNDYKAKNNIEVFKNNNNLGHYLAGLLEGDGHISLPSLGVTTLNRVLNPRIVFTSHINNLGMYAFIQSELGNIGRFQASGNNAIRYIIGDIKGIMFFINLMHGKLRTPKNIRFNDLIKFMNAKYSLDTPESLLDNSNLLDNSWFTGFTESDGHFGIKHLERKPKSDTRKRSVSESVTLKFILNQRLFDKPTSSSMKPFMEDLALFLSCNLKSYTNNTNSEILTVSVSSLESVKFLVNYFNKYPLIGDKLNDFKKWEIVYNMLIKKEHLTDEGRLKIRSLIASGLPPSASRQAKPAT